MPGIGTIVNAITILVGSTVGVSLGGAIPERMRSGIIKAVGLAVFAIGLGGTIRGLAEVSGQGGLLGRYSALVFVGSLVIGTVIGEALGVEEALENLGHKLSQLVDRFTSRKVHDAALGVAGDDEVSLAEREHSLVEGFVTATLIYSIGSMTVLGSIQDGLGNPSTLFLKGMLDGIISIFLASALGVGVALSAIPVVIVQGTITLIAFIFGDVIPAASILQLEIVGGVLIAAIGFDQLDIKRLPIGNMMPSVFVAMLLGWLLS